MRLQSAIDPKVLLGISLLSVLPALAVMGANAHPAHRRRSNNSYRAMHAKMEMLPTIRVGLRDADIVGSDNRSLQAAVDYVAAWRWRVVEIGPGEYLMRDSLHLRPWVTVRGSKAGRFSARPGGESPLAVDGDYGEEQITVADPKGFDVGYGVAIWDNQRRISHYRGADHRATGRRCLLTAPERGLHRHQWQKRRRCFPW